MPLRRRRRRWDSGMACHMPLRRACIDSLPRYCMPHHPIHLHTPHPPHAESSSSQSDCSCFEEEFCTVDNCRNAPMCLSTRPRYCPYGISHQADGKIYRPLSEAQKYCRRMAERNHPQESFNGRDTFPNLAYPQAASSPLSSPEYEKSTECRYPNVHKYRGGIPTDLPVQNMSPSDVQRITHTRLSDAMPQFIRKSPRLQSGADFAPQVTTSRTPDISNSQAHAEDTSAPSAHISLTDSATGEREIVTPQNPIYFDKSTDAFDHKESGKLQEAGYRKVQCTQHGTGCCDTEWDSSKDYTPHHKSTTFDGANGNSPFEPKVTSSRLDDFSRHEELETSGMTPNIHGFDPSTIGKTNQTLFDCSQTRRPMEKPPDHYSTLTRDGAFNASKCSCRYPPSFKHLSCTGNISGSCSCDD